MAARAIDQQQQQVQMSNWIEGGHTATPSGHKTLLRSGALIQYILDTSVYPRESAPLRELRKMTANLPWNFMSIPADEGQFLGLLMKLMNAKNTIELGVFTGYSLLSTALALPQDGKIIAMDIDRQAFELGLPYIKKAGVLHKIDFREGQALSLLEELIEDKKNWGFFDFAFVDADKCNYLNYHKILMKLVKVGGLIAYDNTLWNGTLVDDNNESFPNYIKIDKPFVLAFNKALSLDSQIDLSMVPIGDGISLCRRVL